MANRLARIGNVDQIARAASPDLGKRASGTHDWLARLKRALPPEFFKLMAGCVLALIAAFLLASAWHVSPVVTDLAGYWG